MIDWIKVWVGQDSETLIRYHSAQQRAQDARTRVYLPVYWRRDVDADFERQFACFEPGWEAAA